MSLPGCSPRHFSGRVAGPQRPAANEYALHMRRSRASAVRVCAWHRRVARQGGPARPAGHRPHPPEPGTGSRPAVPVLPPLRRRRPSRTATPGHDRRDMVAGNPRVPAHGHHLRRLRRHQPGHQTVARDAYGFRNPIKQRLRTRTTTTAKPVGISTSAKFEGPQSGVREPHWSSPSRRRLAYLWNYSDGIVRVAWTARRSRPSAANSPNM